MNAKIKSILFVTALASCGTSSKNQYTDIDSNPCNLNARYTFNYEQAEYYAMPKIDFSFRLDYEWQVLMPEFGKQNFSYFEVARYTDDSTASILVKVHPFKRVGSYITVNEQAKAQEFLDVQYATRDSWKTLKKDTMDNWMVDYGYYEQEPFPYIIAHHLILPDTLSNGLFLELQMPCPMDSFDLNRQRCLEAVMKSFKIYM
jgi:hypothetical protein